MNWRTKCEKTLHEQWSFSWAEIEGELRLKDTEKAENLIQKALKTCGSNIKAACKPVRIQNLEYCFSLQSINH
jgi:hypothetical protein